MSQFSRRRVLLVATSFTVLAGMLSACSTNTSSSPGTANSTSTVSAQWKNIRAMLPADVRKSGVLKVGTSAAYPPYDFYAGDNKTVIGIDPDLAALVGTVLGVKFEFTAADFSSLITGMGAGRYDLVWQDAGDRKARQQQVDIVDYNRNTSTFLVAQGSKMISAKSDICGKTVAIEKGTAQVDYMSQQTADCKAAGKQGVTVSVFPSLDSAVLAVRSGRAFATTANASTINYIAKQSNGALVAGGPSYFSVLTGVLTPKKSPLTKPIQAALQAIVDDGSYLKVLNKYGAEQSGLHTITVNAGTDGLND
jgi:polar amino acid transport system substrate-binding protein